MASRNKKKKFADYVLYREPSVPIAVIEAKDNNHTVRRSPQAVYARRRAPGGTITTLRAWLTSGESLTHMSEPHPFLIWPLRGLS
jgi:hypothetical protein